MTVDGKKVWLQGTTVMMRNGKIVFTKRCPCDCEPRVLHSTTVDGSSDDRDEKCWDLKPYQGNDEGTPFARWRLMEVGEDRDCSGTHYGSGEIDECGKLVGLDDEFCSSYDYKGYMEIQQGCYRPDLGKWEWPCPEDSEERYT